MIRRSIFLAIVLSATAVVSARAQGGGAYIGGSVGASALGQDIEDLDLEDALAWKAFTGYSFGRFIALEAGYNNFGSHGAEDLLEQKSWGVSGFGILKLNLGPIDLFGKLGMAYGSATTDLVGVSTVTDTGTGVAYGGGLAVNLGKLGIRGEAEWFDVEEVGKPVTVTGGLTIRF